MTIAKRIKEARRSKRIKQEDVAEAVGASIKTIQRWESGESTPNANKIEALAGVLGTTGTYLLNGEIQEHSSAVQNVRPVRGGVIEVPVLGPQCTACCGEGFNLADIDTEIIRYELVPEEWLHGPKGDKPPYILQVAGDSMEPLIDDGERILVNPNLDPTHGRIVVACWNDYTMVRAVHFERNGDIRLRARNTAYQDVLITAKDAPEVLRFGGVVTEFLGRARPATGFF